ncbi:DUF2480 family protein [Cytophagales bacterium LB-30]|uniref:DUF2480 family protein n=1 Tax=Shiella aurantiaca TaxID=3058365 RepID=A0ABT8F6Q3_9BACT|nr:DUF2480 family protein [Shiella aurantiaca]MDN4166171.1 DUF2480 family protein [Shiella aurantiaca]
MTSDTIVNKVEASGLITIDLETFLDPHPIVSFDLKDCLYQGLILKEKEFRTFLKEHNWQQYANTNVAIECSADAIIPNWAYMLLITNLYKVANYVQVGTKEELINSLLVAKFNQMEFGQYLNAKVVIKGCSNKQLTSFAYAEITRRLLPFSASIMFGEPCSTVPVFKKTKF